MPTFTAFGHMPVSVDQHLRAFLGEVDGLHVPRNGEARSSTPFPKSTDLELALMPRLVSAGFLHHHDLLHPKTGDRFEYDFWRPSDGVAIEIMG